MKKPLKYTQRSSTSATHPPGFTLVEILVVVAIISVLITAGVIGLGNLAAGKGTATAIATTESLFEEARTIAVSKRCKARVLVDVNDPASDSFLRRVAIIHQQIDTNGNVVEDKWTLASRGYVMPGGTYYSRDLSKLFVTDSRGDGRKFTLNSGNSNATARFSGDYVYYEFNAEGISLDPGASFIIGAGVRPKGADAPKVTKSAENDFAGFVIWRNGSTSAFRSIDQIKDHSTGQNLPSAGSTF